MSSSKIGRRIVLSTALVALFALLAPVGALAAQANSAVPRVSTGGVGHVRGTSAELLGSVDPRNLPTTYFFQYGPTSAYGSITATGTIPAGTKNVKVGQAVAKIVVGYHYRIVATNAAGTALGKDRTYTTKTAHSKFSFDKEERVAVYGSPDTVTGVLSGTTAPRPVALQSSPFPFLEPFVNLGLPGTTSSTGRFALRVAKMTSSTQFRVSTLEARPQFSPVLTVHVAYKVVLHVRSSAQKGIVRLYGTVTPAKVGARVELQLEKAIRPTSGKSEKTSKFSSQFTTKTAKATKSFSRFSAIVKVHHSGRYRAYVEASKASPLTSGTSASVKLTAAPESTHKQK